MYGKNETTANRYDDWCSEEKSTGKPPNLEADARVKIRDKCDKRTTSYRQFQFLLDGDRRMRTRDSILHFLG